MHVFFYGTLMAEARNPTARALHAHLTPGIPARTEGLLYAIPDPAGWYPALLPGAGEVNGALYATTEAFTAEDLARIDAWEGYDPAAPARGDYARVDCLVRTGGGIVTAQAYRWIAALPAGAEAIPEGDFAAFIARTGRRVFGA